MAPCFIRSCVALRLLLTLSARVLSSSVRRSVCLCASLSACVPVCLRTLAPLPARSVTALSATRSRSILCLVLRARAILFRCSVRDPAWPRLLRPAVDAAAAAANASILHCPRSPSPPRSLSRIRTSAVAFHHKPSSSQQCQLGMPVLRGIFLNMRTVETRNMRQKYAEIYYTIRMVSC